jgi:hypothetical protein
VSRRGNPDVTGELDTGMPTRPHGQRPTLPAGIEQVEAQADLHPSVTAGVPRREPGVSTVSSRRPELVEGDSQARRQAMIGVAITMAVAIVGAALLEYTGWRIAGIVAFQESPVVGLGRFVGGMTKTVLGAITLGLCGSVMTLPWRTDGARRWRRLSRGFAIGVATALLLLTIATASYFW